MTPISRLRGPIAGAAISLSLAACGGDDDGNGNDQADPLGNGPSSTTLTPEQAQAPELPSVDGYLISASEQSVVLRTADGELTFAVDPQDLPALGVGHLQSHAGLETIGFRVFYGERGSQRFAKQAREIPPPPTG